MSYQSIILSDSPIAYWRMEDDPASFTLVNEAGGGYDVAVFGGGFTSVTGKVNQGSNWGGNSFGYLDPGIDLASFGEYSIEVWVKPLVSESVGWVTQAYDGAAFGYEIGTAISNFADPGNVAEFGFYDGASWHSVKQLSTLSPTAWTHVVGVMTTIGSGFVSLKLYINGVLNVTESNIDAPLSSGNTTSIAVRHDGVTPMSGSLDEVAVYGHALTAADVLEHYLAASGGVSLVLVGAFDGSLLGAGLI